MADEKLNTDPAENTSPEAAEPNVPKKPRRIGGRWSVLDRLHIKQAQRKQKDQTQQQQQQERSRKN